MALATVLDGLLRLLLVALLGKKRISVTVEAHVALLRLKMQIYLVAWLSSTRLIYHGEK